MRAFFLLCLVVGALCLPKGAAAEKEEPRVLIVYYSLSNVTHGVAEQLQARTGADIFRVETVRSYPATQPGLYDDPKKELDEHKLPELKAMPPDFSDYDLVLIGGPVWWYTVPTPIMKLLEDVDFKGKKTAFFCTHEGGVGRTFPHFKEQAKNAVVLDGLDLFRPNRTDQAELGGKLDAWLESLRSRK